MVKLICLMPTYNKQDTLAKAIESVMAQQTNFSYQLIILDDCSTDKSHEIALKYQKKYADQIKIVKNNKNMKLLRTIMHGYTLLKGADYFCVLDADDYYTDSSKFQKAVDFLDKHKNYSMYMTNIILKKKTTQEPYYKGKRKTLDFDAGDARYGESIFMQTSGVIYRNLYFKKGENEKFNKILQFKYPECFRADGFRFEWYLKGGKAHFENINTAVYNYDTNGIWSSQTLFDQYITNAKLMVSCAQFFPNESKYYMKKARQLFFMAMENAHAVDSAKFAKNKDVLCDLFLEIYPKRKNKFLKILVNLIPIKRIKKKVKNFLELQ